MTFETGALCSNEGYVSCHCGEEVHEEVSECLMIAYPFPKGTRSSLPWKFCEYLLMTLRPLLREAVTDYCEELL